jgi:fibronectin type 3 domain-containing protein
MWGALAAGSSATIGIENQTGSIAVKYSYNEGVITDNMAILFNRTNLDHDMAVLELDAPIKGDAGVPLPVWTEVANMGLTDQTGVNISFQVNGTPVNWTGPVLSFPSFTMQNMTFWWTPPGGNADYELSVRVVPTTWENVTYNNERNTTLYVRSWNFHVLIDQTHGCANYREIQPALIDMVQNSVNFELHTMGPISAGTLSGFDVFMSLRPVRSWWTNTAYAASERSAIKDFVTNKSHGLLVMGAGGGPAYMNHNSLTSWAGIDWYHWNSTQNEVTNRIRLHEVTLGLTQVELPALMAKLDCTGKGEMPLINDTTTTPNATGEPMLAVALSGSGKIVAYTDHLSFGNTSFTHYDNTKLFQQIIAWFYPDTDSPAMPTGLALQVRAAGNSLKVTWDANTDIDLMGYSLTRAQGSAGGTYTEILNNISRKHSFLDTGLTDGIQYFYKVAAFDEMPNLSPYTTPVSGTPADTKLPDTPVNLTANNTGTGDSLLLAWEAAAAADVDGYALYSSDSEGGTYAKVTEVNAATLEYNHTGLTEDQTYWYKVATLDEVPNESDHSLPASGIPHDIMAPGAPTGVGVLDTGWGGRLEVYWNANPEDDVSAYKVFRAVKSGGPYVEVAEAGAEDASFHDTGLTDGETYYYTVTAVDDAEPPNESPASMVADGSPTDFLAPAAPANLTATFAAEEKTGGQMAYSVRLDWEAPGDADVDGYRVYRSSGPAVAATAQYFMLELGYEALFWDDITVEEDETYHYTVTAVDEVPNESPPAAAASAEVADLQAPATPEGLAITAPDAGGELVISWERVDDKEVEFYTIYTSSSSGGPYATLVDREVKDRPEHRHQGLTDGDTYFYRVTASDDADPPNESPLSDAVSGTPRDALAPATPLGLLVVPVPGGGSLEVSWTANTEDDLAGYYLYRRTSDGALQDKIATLGPGETYHLDTGLENGKEYLYAVAAFDGAPNVSPQTPEASGTPADSVPPGAPGNVRTTVTGGTVTVSWDAVEDEGVETYIVYVEEDSGWKEVDRVDSGTTGTTYEASADGSYTFKVVAVDGGPNVSDDSAETTATVTGTGGVVDGGDGDGGSGGSDKAGGDSGTTLMVLVIVIIVVVVVVLLLVMMRKKKPAPEDGAGDAAPSAGADLVVGGPQPGAPGPAPQPGAGPAPQPGAPGPAPLTPGGAGPHAQAPAGSDLLSLPPPGPAGGGPVGPAPPGTPALPPSSAPPA